MEAANQVNNVYDQVLYPSGTLPQTHPNRLATVAYLRGVQPAPVDRCRVLELGCGTAANLIPMAFHLPESEFVGLDSAKRPIASGQSFITRLGLRNIALHSLDLREARVEQFGHFDFIIVHGVYSWVPLPVRERILAICQEMLTPEGVAYVSYNAYPGNHFRDLARGIMRFHVSDIENPTDKIGQARGLLKFLSESRAKPDYYTEAIRAEFERVRKYTDAAFFHDDLNEVNQPFYFYEFIADAKRYGLQFVGEASSNQLNLEELTPQAASTMVELEAGNEIAREQFKDFLRATGFRQTILCREGIALAPDLLARRVRQLYAMCDAARVKRADGDSSPANIFRRARGDEIETADPLVTAALDFLCSQCPCHVSFDTLLEVAQAALSSRPETANRVDDAVILEGSLLKAYRAGFLLLNTYRPKVVNRVNECPATSKLARCQLSYGDYVTNQLHISRRFPDPFSRQLVLLLDGSRDQAALTRDLIQFAKSTGDPVYENGVPIADLEQLPAAIERRLPEALASLAHEGMLAPE